MKIFIYLFFLFGSIGFSQDTIPTDYFNNPIKIPLILSGNFGELRSNHFHSGLDIKTQHKEGVPVYAPADGYVKRIKISQFGYGKALYLSHPNGYTTVYAHLQKYDGPIQYFVKKNQYKKEIYTLELFPEKDFLSVKKGDLIGFTGNTGSSVGPHLHFEIRDAYSRPMNPLLFGIEIPDTKKPIINSVIAYPIGKDAQINQSQNPQKLRLILQKDGSYKTENIIAYGKIGFGISTFDQQNGASNKNGVYLIESTNNGIENFQIHFDKFSFAETRYLNRFIDYAYFKNNKSRVQKLFRETNNPLSIIKCDNDMGFVTIQDGYNSIYTIEINDYKNNNVKVTIPIHGKKSEILNQRPTKNTADFSYSNQALAITKGKFSVYIPANSLYENAYLDIQVSGDTLKIHEDIIPLHKRMTITADVSNYKDVDLDKLYFGKLNYKKKPFYNTTYRQGTKITTKTNTFGRYILTIDTKEPIITPINFSNNKWISNNQTLKIKIKDDLSGISSYKATINGLFILMEYNHKSGVLTYDFDDNIISETENNLKVIVVDNVGNNATFEAIFFRK